MVPAGLCAYRDLRRKRARKWGDTVTQPDDPRRVGVIVELIDHTIAIAKLNERGDLVQRLTRARQRITDPQVRVVIAGLLKQGKSQLLNSLLNLPAARVGDDEATVVITVVSYSAQPSARLVLAAGPDGTTAAVDIPVDDISTDVRRAPHAGGREVLRVEVGAPSPLLRGGLAFIDTPGVGGLGQPHLSATLGLLPEADAVLVVSDTSQEFTEPEMWFVRQAHQICPVGAVVATKTDLYPRWREIVNANAAHLQRARVPMPIIAVSSLLRSHAVTLNDKELNEESNFPAIVKFLSEQVLSRATERVRAGVLGEIRSATEQLAVSLGSELSVVNDPNLRDRLASDLERRKREAQQAVQQTALWQQVLGDGFNDLTADVDHDLRTRFRTVTEDAERQIDSCDPTAHWAEIGNDVENAIATAVGDNFVWAYQRSEALADDVARSFADAGLDSVLSAELSPHVMGTDFGRLKALGRMESKPLRRGHKMIIGMRGSYGGVVMIGMLSSVVGLGLFNPLSVGAGLILGRMAYKEDKQNRLLRVRSEAKANVRRFVDDISFVVSKQSRDRLKMIQRLLRDHYREIAEEIRVPAGDHRGGAGGGNRAGQSNSGTSAAIGYPEPGQRQPCRLGANLDAPGELGTSVSTSDRVRAILHATIQAYRGAPAYRQRGDVFCQLDRIGARLAEPLRIALAGTLKAGKSTLVNALVGDDIAPTDATEATRIVTWFRHGPTPRVTANHRGGRRANVPITRRGGLSFDLRRINPAELIDLEVEWPAEELIDATIVDTPGTSSLACDASERTLRLLVPADGVPRVDAVVFLLRTLNAADVALLKQIGGLVGGSVGALGIIGVASRADEIGAGRIDAMLSANDVAKRFTRELNQMGICQAVVPVSGLLALTARTLRQTEFIALRKLAGAERTELNRALLSVDRFVRRDSPLPVDAGIRAQLLERFGMFGIRMSIAVLAAGVTDSTGLAAELLERSGLVALRNVIDQQFAQRSDMLKAHTALVSLRRFVQTHPVPATPYVIADIDPLLADTHAFEELRMLSLLPSRATTLNDDEIASLRRIIGGSGTSAAARLGLDPANSREAPRAALAAAQHWRRRAAHPLNDPFTTRACRAAVRSAEAMVAEFSARR